MTSPIEREIERFAAFSRRPPAGLRVEPLCEYGIAVDGTGDVPSPPDKDFGLVLMGITHGNEWAGAAVVNEILAHLQAGHLPRRPRLAFVLGNPWAARANKRFLDRDLNRCFGGSPPDRAAQASSREAARAAELAPVLRRTAFLVDFHQTSRESDRAFFIFPYVEASFAFAQRIAPRLTVVTHWGEAFSAEGMCTDEFVNSQGGVGVSLEVGQNGLDPYQIAVGTEAGLWAIRTVAERLSGAVQDERHGPSDDLASELYTFAEVVPWPAAGVVEMAPGWRNFKDVSAGDLLGTADGRPLRANSAGKMLFPKYLTPEQQAGLASRPTELCRILRRVTRSELP